LLHPNVWRFYDDDFMTTVDHGAAQSPSGAPPSRLAFVRETRALGELLAFRRDRRALIASLPAWPCRDVLVLPGFLSGDWATAPLRGALAAVGHRVQGWGMGRNLGVRPGVFEALETRLIDAAASAGQPVALIGWSLGGLLAVELARRWPQAVRQVITLGSPVSGDLYANNAWPLYQRVAGHSIAAPPIDWQPGALPAMPFTAIAARGDGIVSPASAHARPGPMVENMIVPGSHAGLGWNPHAIRIIADRLAQH
jgi:pimeloyl-ACP methyl ester carboxylesterase